MTGGSPDGSEASSREADAPFPRPVDGGASGRSGDRGASGRSGDGGAPGRSGDRGASGRSGDGGASRGGAFAARYGPWGVVAGASEGLGAAFAEALARRGLNLVVIARRGAPLDELAERLRRTYGIEVVPVAMDLGSTELGERLAELREGREVGIGIYNAAYAPIGSLDERSPAELTRAVDVNVRGPLLFARALAPAMLERGRGGLVLMSSLAGLQGSPRIATYAATKAFATVLAESLWGEWRERGLDVLASCPGAVRTPGYARHAADEAPGTLAPAVVVERTLSALGRTPRVVPGVVNRLAGLAVGRWLPRSTAVRVMAAATRGRI